MNSGIPDIAAVKDLFAQWQQSRCRASSRIPVELWDLAVELCKAHSVSCVSGELGIARSKLYARLARIKVASIESDSAANKDPFVTVQLEAVAIPDVEMQDCEWVRTDGSRLRIRMPVSEVPRVVSLFLNGG
jgi:hypothetical protein